jgi:hypothetical protein
MSKLPAFQFYPGDWRKDLGVQSLNYHDRGVWFEMLCLMHESERRGALMLNGQPMPRIALARVLGLPLDELNETIDRLIRSNVVTLELPLKEQSKGYPEVPAEGVNGREDEGVIICRRMVRDEARRQEQTEDGKRGGNPALGRDYNEPGFVYAIQRQSDSRIKIGISVNPTKRLYKLRYENKGDTLTLLATKYVQDMGTSEAELHQKYAEFALGEWFILSPQLQKELIFTLKGQSKEQLKGQPGELLRGTPPSSSSSSSSSSVSFSASASALTSFKKESPPRSGQNAFLSPAEGVSPEKPMDEAWMIARAVIEGTNITNQWAVDQIAKQAELELKAHPGEMDAIRDGMIGAWNAYQACAKADKLRTAPMGAQKFFGEGIWKKSSMWGMKKGMRAYENST